MDCDKDNASGASETDHEVRVNKTNPKQIGQRKGYETHDKSEKETDSEASTSKKHEESGKETDMEFTDTTSPGKRRKDETIKLRKRHKRKKDRSKKRKYDTDSSESSDLESIHSEKSHKKKSKKRRIQTENSDISVSLASEAENRSVLSETVSRKTFFDNESSYSRFNPHKKEKVGIQLSSDMKDFIDDNFNLYLSSKQVSESILKTAPVPECEAFKIKKVDPLVTSILEQQNRSLNKHADRSYTVIQSKLINTMGPLTHLWKLLEDTRKSVESGSQDQNNSEDVPCLDNLDFRQILDLVEKTICCVGQTNVCINFQRRMFALTSITRDGNKAKEMLKEKQEILANNDELMFGKDFKSDLKEFSEMRKDACKMAEALGAKPKFPKKDNALSKFKVTKSKGRTQDKFVSQHGQVEPPFRPQPSFARGAYRGNGRNGGKTNKGSAGFRKR